jgi:hypothetical protein
MNVMTEIRTNALTAEVTRLKNVLNQIKVTCRAQIFDPKLTDDNDAGQRDWGKDLMAEDILDIIEQAQL